MAANLTEARSSRKSNQKKFISWTVYIVLMGYLIARYSSLGLTIARLIGIPYPAFLTGVNAIGIPLVLLLSASFLGLYFSIFRFQYIDRQISEFNLNDKGKILLMILAILTVSLIGLANYNVYTDENRDFLVLHAIENHGINLYLDNIQADNVLPPLNETDLAMLDWARKLHPPLHYFFAASISSLFGGEKSIQFYRLIFFSAFTLWLILIFRICMIFRVDKTLIFSFTIIPFSSTYFRNYVLIRSGIEFFAFIGFTTFMLFIYLNYHKNLRAKSSLWLIPAFSILIALFGKFSTIVAMLALISAAALMCVFSKCSGEEMFQRQNGLFIKLFWAASAIFIGSLSIYFLTFRNTFMLEEQLVSYIGKISQFLPFISTPENYTEFVSEKSKSDFFVNFIFWYSPTVTFGLTNGLYQIIKQAKNLDNHSFFDGFIVLWLLFGIVGVLLVNPRAMYTSPLFFGLIYVVWRGLKLTKNDFFIKKYLFISLLFGCAEVLLMASSFSA